MLYGFNPYFGLNIAEIMNNIRKQSGNNLLFDDRKNKVSDLSKDLLRRLLEQDPDKRIDWDSFFNHPVFKGKHIDQGQNPRIEKEFQDNKYNHNIDKIPQAQKSMNLVLNSP